MKTAISEQQTAFFTKNGFIEFEIAHPEIKNHTRDAWRKEPQLQQFLTRTLAPIAFALTGKNQLRLGCDQWISEENRPKEAALLKDLFSIQGFALAVVIAENPVIPARRSPLGILPLPTKSETILFFRPNLILDWPHVKSDLYLALYTLPNAVYVHNPHDPQTHYLKAFGYHFGDVLKNESHPLLVK